MTIKFAGIGAVLCGALGLVVQLPIVTLAQETLPAPVVEEAASESEQPAAKSFVELLGGSLPETLSSGYFGAALSADSINEDTLNAGYDASNALDTLYGGDVDAATAAATVEKLTASRDKLNSASNDPKVREAIGRIDNQLELFALLDEALSSQSPEVIRAAALSRISNSLAAADSDLNRVDTGEQWKTFFHFEKLAAATTSESIGGPARKTMRTVKGRLSNQKLYTAEQLKFVQRESLQNLSDSIGHFLKVSTDKPAAIAGELTASLKSLVAAYNDYQFLGKAEAAAEIRSAIDTLPSHGAGAIAEWLQAQFLEENFRVTMSEDFVQKLITDSRCEKGLVNDCILGTRVVGDRWTASNLSVNLSPSSHQAQIEMLLNGTVTTKTRGLAEQATVFTKGNHTFVARKTATFDGDNFSASGASVGVNVRSHTYAATPKTKLPIVKGIVRKVALQRAAEMKPRTNAITRGKVSRRVVAQFDERLGEAMDSAEDRLNSELYPRLRDAGIYPAHQHVSTTDDTLDLVALMAEGNELAAAAPPATPIISEGLLGQVHESYLNNALSRMNFAGRTMSTEDVKQEFERFFGVISGKEVEMGSRSEVTEEVDTDEEVNESKFVFADKDPMRVRIEAGQVNLIMTAGLESPKRMIPTKIITIPLKLTVEGEEVVVNRGRVDVDSKERSTPVVIRLIRNKVEQSFPERRIDGSHELELQSRTMPVQVQSIEATSGWLTLHLK